MAQRIKPLGGTGHKEEKMPNIKFSYPFKKLYQSADGVQFPIQKARLIQVIPINLIDITQELRDYDTDFDKYELPAKGEYLLLIFQKTRESLFTTIRRSTPEKRAYYEGAVGQVFNVVVEQPVKQ